MPWLPVVAIAAAAGTTAASPADDPATDGAVFAGVTGADPANATTNPAALLRLAPGVHVYAITTTAYDRLAIDRRVVDPATGGLRPAGRVTGATIGGGVTAGFVIGTAHLRMLALQAALPPPDETVGDPALAEHTRGSRTREVDWVAGAGGFAITSRLYLGLAATLVGRHTVLRYTRDTALAAGHDPARGVDSDCGGAPCGLSNPFAEETWRVDVREGTLLSLDNLRYSVGLIARLPGGVWLGLATERPWQIGRYTMTGDATIVTAPRDGGATVVGAAVINTKLPDVIRLGGRGPLGRGWELTGELRLRHLERTGGHGVRVFGPELAAAGIPEIDPRPTGLDDALGIELGAEQVEAGQTWRFGGRLGYDTGAVLDPRLSARAPWSRQLTAAVGAQLRLDRWTLQLGYRFDWQPTVTGGTAFDPQAAIACTDAAYDYDLPACATLRAGYGTTTAAGDYARQSHTLRVALRFLLP